MKLTKIYPKEQESKILTTKCFMHRKYQILWRAFSVYKLPLRQNT